MLAVLNCADGAEEGSKILRIALSAPKDLGKAEFSCVKTVYSPTAVLVLCPGCNGDGAGYLTEPAWLEFAKERRLALMAVSFSSEPDLLRDGRGYYYASNGSGQVLLDAISTLYHRDLPILIYGFSGGAHFTSRFAEWKPERVIAWCAYSAAWWDKPKRQKHNSFGIVACGAEDSERYGASLDYFVAGRAIGDRWTWVSIPKRGHSRSPEFEEFLRRYFAAMLKTNAPNGTVKAPDSEWRDVETKAILSSQEALQIPTVAAWLPDHVTATLWSALHAP
jgi:pimeloyl-ACP methyl ester carboxylesterase